MIKMIRNYAIIILILCIVGGIVVPYITSNFSSDSVTITFDETLGYNS